jgi:hypothetical protein
MKLVYLILITFGSLSLIMSCEDKTMSPTIQEVKEKHVNRILSMQGVVSVGVGRNPDGDPAIIIGLDSTGMDTARQLPKVLDGYPVIVQIIGPIEAH